MARALYEHGFRRTHPLRRQLGFLGTISLSIGVMAPTLAMAVTGSQAAGLVGRAAPVAYALPAVGVAFVAYGFIRLASHFATRARCMPSRACALGPRAGFISGWALLGTYIVFPPCLDPRHRGLRAGVPAPHGDRRTRRPGGRSRSPAGR